MTIFLYHFYTLKFLHIRSSFIAFPFSPIIRFQFTSSPSQPLDFYFLFLQEIPSPWKRTRQTTSSNSIIHNLFFSQPIPTLQHIIGITTDFLNLTVEWSKKLDICDFPFSSFLAFFRSEVEIIMKHELSSEKMMTDNIFLTLSISWLWMFCLLCSHFKNLLPIQIYFFISDFVYF